MRDRIAAVAALAVALVGSVGDAELARAFFSIWLDPRTREPKLRERLIGIR